MGDSAQKAWARVLAKRGNPSLPIYAMSDESAGTKAPILFTQEGLLVTPDVLCLGERQSWHEVKAKAVPAWFRIRGRWEHGFDYDLVGEYRRVQDVTSIEVWIVVYEESSPADATRDGALEKSGVFLVLSLNDALAAGEHRPHWPGGRGTGRYGRRGKGGWLVPRDAFIALEGPQLNQKPRASRLEA